MTPITLFAFNRPAALRLRLRALMANLLLLATAPASAQAYWNLDRLRQVQAGGELESVRQACIDRANQTLKQAPLTVVKADKPWVTDPHNYASLSIYCWPDTTKPGGLPYISLDGRRNPEADLYDGNILNTLGQRLRWLALAATFTGDTTYRDAFQQQASTFFLDDDTRMLPNFDYAQIHPGRNNNRGNSWGLIEAYFLMETLESLRLINNEMPLDKEVNDGLHNWFRQFADYMRLSRNGVREQKEKNNHGVAYDALLLNMADYLDDDKLFQQLTDSFATRRLLAQIQPDGSQPQELRRNNAFNYSVYNLAHILDFCFIQQSRGLDYYAIWQEPIDKAFAYLWQFVGHQDQFPYREIADWKGRENYLRQETHRLARLKGQYPDFVPTDERHAPKANAGNFLK